MKTAFSEQRGHPIELFTQYDEDDYASEMEFKGNTDNGFLCSIIQRTFEKIVNEFQQEIEIFEPIYFKKRGSDIQEKRLNAASDARENGATVLCLHADADVGKRTDKKAFEERIDPAFNARGF